MAYPSKALAVALLLATSPVAQGQNLGVLGNVYEIQEEDAVVGIKRKLTELQENGTIAQKQEEAKKNVLNTMLNPKPIEGISTASKDQVFFFDPTFTLDKPITDGKGRVIYPAGTTINPLAFGGLSKRLVFIDARDDAQIKFAIEGKKKFPNDKVILTGGSWVNMSKKAGEQVFYDQSGYLTRKFGIQHVPAIVQQEGLRLKITEKAL